MVGSHTSRILQGEIPALRAFLDSLGFTFEARPHQAFLARREGVVVNAYESGAVVVGGKEEPGRALVVSWLAERAAAAPAAGPGGKVYPEIPALQGERAGIDEAGKGDYFGPLVVAGAVIDAEDAQRLAAAGVRDSKSLDDEQMLILAEKLKTKLLGPARCEVLVLTPAKYNELHARNRNVNRTLGWAHARVLETLLTRNPRVTAAISDQFGDERYIRDALQERGKAIRMIQVVKGERDVAVATASVLARAEFVLQMRLMSARHDFRFPLGATHVVEPAKAFVARFGADALPGVAKMHFQTTQRVLGG